VPGPDFRRAGSASAGYRLRCWCCDVRRLYISRPYFTAVESLDPTDKVRLFAIAALGPLAPGLTSDFPGPEQEDRARKIVDMLGAFGNTETVELLHAFTDDRVLGRSAITP
jgi:hypothetical protein